MGGCGEVGKRRTEFGGGEIVADLFDGGDGAVPAVEGLISVVLVQKLS